MKLYYSTHPNDVKSYNTDALRNQFLVESIFVVDTLSLNYSFDDRIIFGGAVPANRPIALGSFEQIRADYFLERREMGIINLGAKGVVVADGKSFVLNTRDCLYIGKGTRSIELKSESSKAPAMFYIASSPAHATFPTTHLPQDKATPAHLGSKSECNERTIYKYIHPDGIKSCQLVMGLTMLDDGSVWNTMPCHTHDRRMEVYLYTDIKENNAVFHLMGEPSQTRHIVVNNNQAVISPSWSIHSGVGTKNYSFIWAMCGENQVFGDMDGVSTPHLR